MGRLRGPAAPDVEPVTFEDARRCRCRTWAVRAGRWPASRRPPPAEPLANWATLPPTWTFGPVEDNPDTFDARQHFEAPDPRCPRRPPDVARLHAPPPDVGQRPAGPVTFEDAAEPSAAGAGQRPAFEHDRREPPRRGPPDRGTVPRPVRRPPPGLARLPRTSKNPPKLTGPPNHVKLHGPPTGPTLAGPVERQPQTGGDTLPRTVTYPVQYTCRLPQHLGDRVAELAAADGRTPAEWIRERVRMAVAAEDKKRQRAAAK